MSSTKETVRAALEKLLDSGAITRDQVAMIMQAAEDPAVLDQILAQLKEGGADEGGPSPPLNIEDYYRDGSEQFDLLWPLRVSLPVPFEQLDRKTRFFVLFQEWTRRELEGVSILNAGQADEAATVFEECLARARQLKVNELVARSHEDLMRVAEKNGDSKAARSYSKAATAARAGQ
jgi:hypothetical protein